MPKGKRLGPGPVECLHSGAANDVYSLHAIISELFSGPVACFEAFVRIPGINFRFNNWMWLMKYSWLFFRGHWGRS